MSKWTDKRDLDLMTLAIGLFYISLFLLLFDWTTPVGLVLMGISILIGIVEHYSQENKKNDKNNSQK